jgi:hypothetical protein
MKAMKSKTQDGKREKNPSLEQEVELGMMMNDKMEIRERTRDLSKERKREICLFSRSRKKNEGDEREELDLSKKSLNTTSLT